MANEESPELKIFVREKVRKGVGGLSSEAKIQVREFFPRGLGVYS